MKYDENGIKEKLETCGKKTVTQFNKKLLTVDELKDYMRIGRNLAYTLVARNDFPSIRIGQRILVPVDLLDEWIKGQARRGEQ